MYICITHVNSMLVNGMRNTRFAYHSLVSSPHLNKRKMVVILVGAFSLVKVVESVLYQTGAFGPLS